MIRPREETYTAVNDAIREIEKYLEEYNPLQIIAFISRHVVTLSLDEHTESEDMLWYPLIEYVMSLSLSKPFPTSPKNVDTATINEILDVWKQLVKNFVLYFSNEHINGNEEEEEKTEASIRFKLILDYFAIRGKAYPPHVEKTFCDLFEPHRNHLIEKIGFSAGDFNDFIRYIEIEVISRFQAEVDMFKSTQETYYHFTKWLNGQDIGGESFDESIKRYGEENPELLSQLEMMKHILEAQP
ncbi:MAG: hypothetical protein K9W43_14310, partial [Candidatus Thorarchaeota archaeon]|nr:hypothetical protein [Candidatus Thorarchaeota archaeon]